MSSCARFPSSMIILTLLCAAMLSSAMVYTQIKQYHGPSFFDDWVFYGNIDNTTNGNATYLSAEGARSSKLVYVNPQTNHSFMRVDHTTNVKSGQRRNSIRITSKDRYPVGSLWVADIYHLPTGCSLWPAWWSFSPNWPRGGEIDTMEGINRLPHNRMGLHTLPGCMQDQAVQPPNAYVNNTDCSYTYNNNQGCLISDLRNGSYGQSFNDARGGVWVTEFASEGISIWFFPRSNVPASLKTADIESLDTKELGSPIGNWPASGCDIDRYFEAQNLVFTIALCGDVSYPNKLSTQTGCSPTCYESYVLGDGSNYADAYFEVGSVNVLQRVRGSNDATNIGYSYAPLALGLTIGLLLACFL